jgi:hypothetical protein
MYCIPRAMRVYSKCWFVSRLLLSSNNPNNPNNSPPRCGPNTLFYQDVENNEKARYDSIRTLVTLVTPT